MALSLSRRALCQAAAVRPNAASRMTVVVRAEGAINPAIKKGEQLNLGLTYSTTAAGAATSGTFCTPSALAQQAARFPRN